MRYRDLESQLRNIQARIDWDLFVKGVIFFVAGLAQKILFADTIAERINPMFSDYHALQFFSSWYANARLHLPAIFLISPAIAIWQSASA